MSDVVLDANVLVGLLDQHDALHERAVTLLESLQQEENRPIMLDIMLTEMISALCRRGAQRKTRPPDLEHVRVRIHAWIDAGLVTYVHGVVAERFERIIDLAVTPRGILNFKRFNSGAASMRRHHRRGRKFRLQLGQHGRF